MASICLLVAGGASLYSWHFAHTAQRTLGTVTELRAQESERGSDTPYAPTFRFRDAGGVEHTVESDVYSYPPDHRVGDAVPVLYFRDHPQDARIGEFWHLWFLPALTGGLGVISLSLGLVILFWPQLVAKLKGRNSHLPS